MPSAHSATGLSLSQRLASKADPIPYYLDRAKFKL
jgi:hypothetical protein